MTISAEQVKRLREKTGAGMMDCRNALAETEGNEEKAIDELRKKGLASAAKKSGRATKEGQVTSYIHAGGKIGVLLEVNCETDFVAKTEEFQRFVHDICLHIAAANPQFVRREEVDERVLESEKAIYRSQAAESGKPAEVVEKIVVGKLDKFFKEICLSEQSYVKDPDKSINDIVTAIVAKLGENISIRRFARFQLGEELSNETNNQSNDAGGNA